MRFLILLLSLTVFMNAKATNSSAPAPAASQAQFFYLENIPNHDQTVVFTLDKVCDSGLNQAPFGIQEFYSEKKYPTNETGKSSKQETVRIVHLYARYNQNCKRVSTEKFEQKFKIPRSKRMTHIYITTDFEVGVRSIQ